MKMKHKNHSSAATKNGPVSGTMDAKNLLCRTEDGLSNGKFLIRLAVFGDSEIALFFSFLLLVVAVCVSFFTTNDEIKSKMSVVSGRHKDHLKYEKEENDDFAERYNHLGPLPKLDPPRVYSIDEDSMESIHKAYQNDGVVAVRGLIPANLLERLDEESQKLTLQESERKEAAKLAKGNLPSKVKKQMQFHTQFLMPMFLEPLPSVLEDQTELETGPHYDATINDEATIENIKNATAFLEVAVLSQVPAFASSLMLPELSEGESVRVMKDIFLAKDEGEWICGWHVDDFGFWPATATAAGINAWIAIDDMPVDGGGSFALAVGSHEASWKDEAHFMTGATTTVPTNGFRSAADMFSNRRGSGTCNIKTTAPHLYRRMEETKRIYELQRGDIIFHQRWLFHRTVAFERDYVAAAKDGNNLLYRRLSVRYSPGSAVIQPGYGTEASVLWDENNGNRTADEICSRDGPWYPKVWPAASKKELGELAGLVATKMPVSQERKQARQQEMQPFLREAAMKQRGKRK